MLSPRLRGVFVGVLSLLLPAGTVRADEVKVAIGGYDTVAYFSEGKPLPGQKDYEYVWHNLRWRFSKGANRDLFARDPDKYAPQYDGYCAMGVGANGDEAAHKDTVDPEAWAIVDGKLYLAHNRHWIEAWKENAREYIREGDREWTAVSKLPDPVIVGPPCTASPPTTRVALKGGGYWIAVAGQLARDEAGKIVGKGDMRAQIEQVGKNVNACLIAGGASVKDIMWTVNYVTDKLEFDKYVDVQQLYFGSPSPKSSTIAVKQLAGPDFLVQVEAFAEIK